MIKIEPKKTIYGYQKIYSCLYFFLTQSLSLRLMRYIYYYIFRYYIRYTPQISKLYKYITQNFIHLNVQLNTIILQSILYILYNTKY